MDETHEAEHVNAPPVRLDQHLPAPGPDRGPPDPSLQRLVITNALPADSPYVLVRVTRGGIVNFELELRDAESA